MTKNLTWWVLAIAVLCFLPHSASALTNKTLGTYPVSAYGGSYAYEVAISGNYAYIADDTVGLEVVNIAMPGTPAHVRTIAMPLMRHLTVAGQYLFLGDGVGLKIYSIADPSTPVYVGALDTPGFTISHIVANSDFVYLSGITSGSEFHLKKVEISNPAIPVLVFGGDVTTGLNAGLALSGNYVYVVGDNKMNIYNATTMSVVALFMRTDTSTSYQGIAVAGTKVYLPDAMNAFDVVDVSNPAVPTLSGFVSGRFADGVAVSGNYAFVATNFVGNLSVINISTTIPTLVDTYAGAYDGNNIVVSGSVAIMANGAGGLRVFDISNPVAPTVIQANPSAPLISLTGSTLIMKSAGDTFTDPGYTATDAVDGTMTTHVIRTGTLNLKQVGVYVLTYTVVNSRGVTDSAIRTVVVLPKLTALVAKKGKFTITVNKKTVQLKPYTSMPATVMAYKAILTTTTTPYYVFLNPAATKPELVIYKSNGKVWKRYALSSISKVGLNAKFTVDPGTLTVSFAATSKKTGPSVTWYKLSSSGLTKLGTIKASTKKTPVTFNFLRTSPVASSLVTFVKGAAAPKVWNYNPITKKIIQATTYNTALLRWTTSKITLR